jgi:hypothetical protein
MGSRRLLLILVAAAVVTPACANTNDGTAVPAAERILRSVASTSAAKSSRFSYGLFVSRISNNDAQLGQEVKVVEGKGVFDYQRALGTIDYKNNLLQVSAATIFIFHETRKYEKLPPELRVKLPAGKVWLETDLVRLDASTGIDSAQQFSGDPSTALAFLLVRAVDVVELPSEKIRGVPTDHYRMRLELSTWRWMASGLPPHQQQILRIKTRPFRRGHVRAEVWIDGQGRVRRLSLTGKTRPPGSLETMDLRARQTYDYFDFGVPVTIALPPQAEVEKVEALLPGGRAIEPAPRKRASGER